ncbi:MAG TPA: PAS domain-containing protein [Actinomycetota bacterium]|jgi:PAS domain-containing protein|nr:PAS domain-containing protein [Actinomycetota bacterium]
MSQKPIELILTRQLASYLAMPVFLVDMDGTLVFYNEPAERILGTRFEETGAMPASEWGTVFVPTDERGAALEPAELPLMVALREGRPAHGTLWIHALDSVPRHIEVTAFPLIGQTHERIGAVAIFWEAPV